MCCRLPAITCDRAKAFDREVREEMPRSTRRTPRGTQRNIAKGANAAKCSKDREGCEKSGEPGTYFAIFAITSRPSRLEAFRSQNHPAGSCSPFDGCRP